MNSKLILTSALALVFFNSTFCNIYSTFSIKHSTFISYQLGDTVFKRVDILPVFKGGKAAFYKFVDNNLKYPQEAKDKKIEGKVVVEFIVDRTGKVSNPKIFRGVSKQLDDEALRLISILPKWIPGKIENKPVPSYVKATIHFKLPK